jgi:hydrogenase/urease accessory protein HupE
MKRKMARIPVLVTAALASSAKALSAHQGHGLDGTVQNLLHWLSSPDHVLTILVILGLAGVGAYTRATRSASRRAS